MNLNWKKFKKLYPSLNLFDEIDLLLSTEEVNESKNEALEDETTTENIRKHFPNVEEKKSFLEMIEMFGGLKNRKNQFKKFKTPFELRMNVEPSTPHESDSDCEILRQPETMKIKNLETERQKDSLTGINLENLPKFSGELLAWTEYRWMMFKYVISNKNLSNEKKTFLLVQSLENEPRKHVMHMFVHNLGLDDVWYNLVERYENPMEIEYELFKIAKEFPTIKSFQDVIGFKAALIKAKELELLFLSNPDSNLAQRVLKEILNTSRIIRFRITRCENFEDLIKVLENFYQDAIFYKNFLRIRNLFRNEHENQASACTLFAKV